MATLITNSTAYVNGNVYTINDAQPHAEAFIVASNGTFSHVGTTSAIRELAKEHGLPTYDFDNKFIMPGIHDAHVHLLFAGYALCNEPDIGLTNKLDDIIPGLHSKCCSCAYTNVYGDWLIVNGFNIENFDRAALDEAYPSVPVVIRGAAGHAIYANTQALIRAGIDPNHQADALPAHYKRREDGSLTGECHETAMDSIVLAIPFPKVGHAKRCLKQAIAALHQAGVTSIQEAASNTVMVEALTELDREGSLKLDIATHIVHTPQWIGWESAESLRELLDRAPDMKTDHVDTRFMKVILDGVPLPPLFSQSELGEDGKADLSKLTHQNLASVIEEFDQRGVTCKVHCGGKGSVRTTLDAIETARRKNLPGPHHEIAHCNGVHEDDYPRFKELDCGAEMSPAFLFRHPLTKMTNFMDWNFIKMIKHSAHITIGSDWIGNAPASLLEHCGNVIDDIDQATGGKGGEALCKMLTLNGAQAVGREKDLGSIEVGKKASFIAVSRDLSAGEFRDAKVLKTWFEGELIWAEQ